MQPLPTPSVALSVFALQAFAQAAKLGGLADAAAGASRHETSARTAKSGFLLPRAYARLPASDQPGGRIPPARPSLSRPGERAVGGAGAVGADGPAGPA